MLTTGAAVAAVEVRLVEQASTMRHPTTRLITKALWLIL